MRAAFVACLLFLAACRSTPEPVAPPANAAASANPNFNGVYYYQGQDGVDLLRFTSAGKVLSVSTSSPQSLEPAVRLLIGESDRCATGTYVLTDGILRFTLTSKTGSVDYAGAIKDDKLAARWRSNINSASIEETYTFVKVVDEANDPPPTAERSPSDDPNAGPAAPAGPELTLIPDGSAWFCYRTTGASRCERKQATCESSRKSAAAAHKDMKMGKCAKQANAYCYTATNRAGARGMASCTATEADCKSEAGGLDPDADNLAVSSCTKQ